MPRIILPAIAIAIFGLSLAPAMADTYVNGHYRSNPSSSDQYYDESLSIGQMLNEVASGLSIRRMTERSLLKSANGFKPLVAYQKNYRSLVSSIRFIYRHGTELGYDSDGMNLKAAAKIYGRSMMLNYVKSMRSMDRALLTLLKQDPNFGVSKTSKKNSNEVQLGLRGNEAIVKYVVGDEDIFIWTITNNARHIDRIKNSTVKVRQLVTRFRRSVQLVKGTNRRVPEFDLEASRLLYDTVFAPISQYLDGKSHILLVLDDALQSIPFQALVSSSPKGKIASVDVTASPTRGFSEVGPEKSETKLNQISQYDGARWLVNRYAFTVLPSLDSFVRLRNQKQRKPPAKVFVGFGDPILQSDHHRITDNSMDTISRDRRNLIPDLIRRKFAPLPETVDELKGIANLLEDHSNQLYIGNSASEKSVKSTDLSDARVISFATHGLVSGELKGLAEPALVMTPPDNPDDVDDDGLLTANEISQLNLNADTVILSACNTAAGSSPGAPGLSGLAQAFLFAGSRSVIVSHWSVVSDAAVELTTGMFREMANDNSIGRSEALRRSMMAVAANDNYPEWSHPIYWAPFFVVGEGG